MDKPWYKNWWVWVSALILLVGIVNREKLPITYESSKAEKADNFEYKIVSVQNKKTIGEKYLNKSTENNYVVVKVELVNKSKEAKMIDYSMFKLKDSADTEYVADPILAVYVDSKSHFSLKKINPNIKINGYVVFEVPKSSKGEKYTLTIADDLGSLENVTFNLY